MTLVRTLWAMRRVRRLLMLAAFVLTLFSGASPAVKALAIGIPAAFLLRWFLRSHGLTLWQLLRRRGGGRVDY